MYLYENKVVFILLLMQCVLLAVFIGMQKAGYYKLVRESENMKKTKDKDMINISKNRKNVYNVDNYVDKYVNSFVFCGLKLYTISGICGYLMNFMFVSWSIAIIYGVYLDCGIKEILWTIMLAIAIIGGLFSIGWSVDNYKLQKIAKVNIKNYIEGLVEKNRNREEIVKNRKEHAKNSINNVREKTVIDYESNNKNVIVMSHKVTDIVKENTSKDNLGYFA